MTPTRSLLIGFAVAFATPRLALAQQQFTLDQVLGAPFASDLVAAHRGSSVAWIVNQRGARNVWVANGPSWQPRQVTRYRDDDRRQSLTFMPDADRSWSVVSARRGPPNPALIRGGRSGDSASVDQGTPSRRGSRRSSPSGDSLAFTRGDWVVRMATALPWSSRSSVAVAELRWSPDGKRLAS
jgi:hypothetical protein